MLQARSIGDLKNNACTRDRTCIIMHIHQGTGTTNPGEPMIDFQTDPGRYKHWRLSVDGRVATLE